MRRNIGSVLMIVAGTVIFLLSGLNALFWTSTGGFLQAAFRVVVLAVGVVLIATGASRWSRQHGNTLPRAPRLVVPNQFDVYTGSDLRNALDGALASIMPMSGTQLIDLADIIVAPNRYRERVEEEQTISGTTTHVAVRLVVHNLPTYPAGQPPLPLLALTRQLKSTPYGNLMVEDGDGRRIHTVGFVTALGLSYAIAQAHIAAHIGTMSPYEKHVLQVKLAQIIAEPTDSSGQLGELYAMLAGTSLWTDAAFAAEREAFSNYMGVVAKRRIVYAPVAFSGSSGELCYEFTSAHPPVRDLPPGFDKWRAWKDKVRERRSLPSKFVSVSLARSRVVESYKLHIRVPDGLYIDETHIFAGGGLVEPLDRYVVHRSHISHSRLNGRPDLRVSAWRMREVSKFTDPVVFVRLTETPPGSLFTSSMVALAVVVTTWLTGVISGAALRGSPNSFNVDLAALAVTLPGLLAAWLGLAAPSVANGYRSLTALASLVTSAAIAVASTGSYVGRFAVSRLPKGLFPEGKSFFFLQDWLSAGLLFLALVNFGFVGGLFYARLRRYLACRKG